MKPTVTALAHANIALVKYWGKRDAERNLPAAGSLSLTLDALTTITSVTFDPALEVDQVTIDRREASDRDLARVSTFLDLVRLRTGRSTRARVDSINHFPTASGLASSASGYAALALAAATAADLELDKRELSILARQGSGSAARSIFGGLVRMTAGDDAHAEEIAGTESLASRVRMVVAIIGGGGEKEHGSRDAMQHCAATSPYYRAWVETVERDLVVAEAAIAEDDLNRLGEIAESNFFAMHAAAIASRPSVLYWQPATLEALATVRALRKAGRIAWATMDAGPHVKVLTSDEDVDRVAEAMRDTDGVGDVIICGAGSAAAVLEDR